MKKLIIVVIILFLMICTGCPMGYDPSAEPRATITSQDLFVCGGVSCIYAEVRYPVTIYNPNNYEITITCRETDYPIPAHEHITLVRAVCI